MIARSLRHLSPAIGKDRTTFELPQSRFGPLDLDNCSPDVALMPTSEHWVNASKNNLGLVELRLPHCHWTREAREAIVVTHTMPEKAVDKAAYHTVMLLRKVFDLATGYTLGAKNESCMIRRVIFLETVAAIPGMVGACIRHLKSLRHLTPDYGFIHTLLEEAENERMHLMIGLQLKSDPSKIVRFMVHAAQLVFLALYTTWYSISPRFAHRFVGYLEQEAVKTYGAIVSLMDNGKLPGFDIEAPAAARAYYNLPADASLRDVWMCIRADEDHHREVNHTLADLTVVPNAVNPFVPGY